MYTPLNLLKHSIFTACVLFIYSSSSFGQEYLSFTKNKSAIQETTPIRTIDQQKKELILEYSCPGAMLTSKTINQTKYNFIQIDGFGKMSEVGKPALPVRNDIIALQSDETPKITILETESIEYSNITIHPALPPAYDYHGAPEPKFTIDSTFYNTNQFFPQSLVNVIDIQKTKGVPLAFIQFCPVQYNPLTNTVIVYSKIKYSIEYPSSQTRKIETKKLSKNAVGLLKNRILNPTSLNTKSNSSSKSSSIDYLILTTDEFLTAADTLSKWKQQLGYSVEILSKASWTYDEAKNLIHQKYNDYSPSPDYFVIIGDHEDIPGKVLTSDYGDWATDLYMACMDGNDDYFPDMAYGRISVSTASEALISINKIINYEKNPSTDSSFYNTGLNCAYFQHASNGFAERRFAQTAEETAEYMITDLGYNINRVYYTDSYVSPTNWNNGYYSNGESIPSHLLKPGFAWDGDYTDIVSHINSGSFLVLHRDHGDVNEWVDPEFTSNHVRTLTNGDKLPVVISMNCLSGRYYDTECFVETFTRKQDGGAVGVFGMGNVSISGYNDALAIGIYDAIWSNPGLTPNFTGTGNTSGTLTAHSDIYTMGDVKNQSLLCMIETWGDSWGRCQYEHELYNYFGDPTMRIWTAFPKEITASHIDTLKCGEMSLSINNSSCSDGLATVFFKGEIIGETILSGGNGLISFSIPVSDIASSATLTISAHNHKPYINEIPINSECTIAPISIFTINQSIGCVNDTITLTDESYFGPTTWNWTITPNSFIYLSGTTSSTQNPQIQFTSTGNYAISLITNNNYGYDTLTYDSIIQVNSTVADFSMSAQQGNTGQSLYFTDNSTCSPDSWEWTITPNTISYVNATDSSSQNPIVQFINEGTYTISMKSSNSYGADSISKDIEIFAELIIGTDMHSGIPLPIEPYYGYSYSQTIYKQSSLGASMEITDIYYQWNGNSTWSDDIKVYMGHTTNGEFTNTNDWLPISQLTEVYSGQLSVNQTAGWVEISLNNSYFYNGTDNLVIAIEENTSGYHSSSDEFFCSSLDSDKSSLYYFNDSNDPDPTSPPTGTLSAYTPNTKLKYSPPIPMKYDVSTTSQRDTSQVLSGRSNLAIIALEVSMEGMLNPQSLSSCKFTTTGTSDIGNITKARLYYSSVPVFQDTNTQFGQSIESITDTLVFSDNFFLSAGTNYFWLTYDIADDTSCNGNLLDATCFSFTIDTTEYTPAITTPAGNRRILTLGGPITLPWIENFEDAGPILEYTTSETNINGIIHWEYEKDNNGRLRFEAGSGFYHNGSNAATMDASLEGTNSINLLTATLNLSNYIGSTDLELSFYYMHHGEESSDNDRVWIRGSSNDAWVEIYDLFVMKGSAGDWMEVIEIDIDNALFNAGQSISSSFQLRFGQEDNYPASSLFSSDGFTFDDIMISGSIPAPMTYTSSTVTQNDTLEVCLGKSNQKVIGIKVKTTGGLNPLAIKDFYLNTIGTTNLTDIDSIKLFYTGSNSSYSSDMQFGNTIVSVSNNITISDSLVLTSGTNYFWLTYNICNDTSSVGNFIDAGCDSIFLNSTMCIPANNNPQGNRMIDTIQAYWTWMLYLYEDNTGLDGADDINEWEANGSIPDQVNYIVLYDSDNDAKDGIYYIEKDPNGYDGNIISTLLVPKTDPDMNDWETLRDFIIWGEENYPAQHYGLTVWDHGSGIFDFDGVFGKETKEGESAVGEMKLWEMEDAVSQFTSTTGEIFDIIGFDVCLMGQIETVYELKDYSNYIIASEKTEPGDGWDYVAPFARLNANPEMNAETIATHIVEDYITSYSNGSQGTSDVTQAVTSTSLFENTLLPALNSFADSLTDNMSQYKTNYLTAINSSWIGNYNPNHKDLGDFALHISNDISLPSSIRNEAQNLITAISTAVISEGHTGSSTDGASGLKTWMTDNITTEGIYQTYYTDTANFLNYSKTKWDEFLYALCSDYPMSYVSATTKQQTGTVSAGSTNQSIICIEVVCSGGLTPLALTSLSFNTNGTTVDSDISKAKVFYTATNNSYSNSIQFGSDIDSPSGDYSINGSIALCDGINHFWLVYDISDTATISNYVDAECTAITVDSSNHTPTISAPTGNKQISNIIEMTSGTNSYTLCASTFVDDGGSSGQYSNSFLGTTTFYPSTPGALISIEFTSFYTESCCDDFYIYDGNSSSASLIGTYRGSTIPPSVTSTAADGSLTIVFDSDGSITYSGWEASISCFIPANMSYKSSTCTQHNTGIVLSGSSNQPIIRIDVETEGGMNPLTLANFSISSNGTTKQSDITKSTIFYTGSDSLFNTSTQFGNAINSPDSTFSISGSQTLLSGVNYFWVTYDITDDTLSAGNSIDAECNTICVGNAAYSIYQAPAGYCYIFSTGGPIILPWTEGFESILSNTTYNSNQTYINESPVWSYEKTVNGRLRFQAGDNFYLNGNRSATMDASPDGSYSINYLTATLNLANYQSDNNIVLSFNYMHHSEEQHDNDKVWIRGSDTDTWIEIYDLFLNQGSSGVWNTISNFDIDSALSVSSQSMTSTFQLRLGQEDNYEGNTITESDGYTFDDICIMQTIITSDIAIETSIYSDSEQVLIYPNPSKGDITLLFSENKDIINLEIISLEGKVIHTEELNNIEKNTPKQLQLNHLSKGAYIIKLQNTTFSKRLPLLIK